MEFKDRPGAKDKLRHIVRGSSSKAMCGGHVLNKIADPKTKLCEMCWFQHSKLVPKTGGKK